jgi:hypothetical protein
METNEFQGVTIKKLLTQLFDTTSPESLLFWPPNLFAFTSNILHRTGCYRVCNIEDLEWNIVQRNLTIADEGFIWIRDVGRLLRNKSYEFNAFRVEENCRSGIFENAFKIIKENLDFPLVHLRIVVSDPVENFSNAYRGTAEIARKIAKALVDLHALSDVACISMGMVDDNYSGDPDVNLALSVANFLLITHGTLGTLDKMHGSVLPKFRTPQQGQSLRSLSHHVTFHETETEIVWRSIPWLDTNEHSINILAVPFPFSTHAKDFTAVPYKNHPTRYFRVEIEEFSSDRITLIHSLVDKLIDLRSRISRVHIVLLPELALTKSEYDYLLLLLFKYRKEIKYLPMVIAGVMSDDYSDEENPHAVYNNEVKIASYFAGRWYDLNQRKHHRWRLDKNQLIQYSLATKLATHRKWFEYISTSQRKLTVLSTNSWLSLVALICEDLARLEPVSEVIRGIGPTLMLALLSDGPQLSNRWPARYATVFADDPGTSVFSLTSLGMAKRSNKNGADPFEQEKSDKHVIGLWKDSNNANREISVDGDLSESGKNSVVLTLSAKSIEEFTLDGRSDENNASELELDTYFRISLKKRPHDEVMKEHADLKSKLALFSKRLGNWAEIRDISLIYYFIDDIVSNQDQNLTILEDLLLVDSFNHSNSEYRKISFLISKSLRDPLNMGLSAREVSEWPSNEVRDAMKSIRDVVKDVLREKERSESILQYYIDLFNSTESMFQTQFELYKKKYILPKSVRSNNTKKSSSIKSPLSIDDELNSYRVKLAVCIAICILIQSKINDSNVKGNFYNEANQSSLSRDINILNEDITKFLSENYNEFSLYPGLIFNESAEKM